MVLDRLLVLSLSKGSNSKHEKDSSCKPFFPSGLIRPPLNLSGSLHPELG